MDSPRSDALDHVRTRFPSAPDTDADGLRAHAEHLARLRNAVDRERLRGVEPAMTFDPTKETT
jgi:hypothetical protein